MHNYYAGGGSSHRVNSIDRQAHVQTSYALADGYDDDYQCQQSFSSRYPIACELSSTQSSEVRNFNRPSCRYNDTTSGCTTEWSTVPCANTCDVTRRKEHAGQYAPNYEPLVNTAQFSKHARNGNFQSDKCNENLYVSDDSYFPTYIHGFNNLPSDMFQSKSTFDFPNNDSTPFRSLQNHGGSSKPPPNNPWSQSSSSSSFEVCYSNKSNLFDYYTPAENPVTTESHLTYDQPEFDTESSYLIPRVTDPCQQVYRPAESNQQLSTHFCGTVQQSQQQFQPHQRQQTSARSGSSCKSYDSDPPFDWTSVNPFDAAFFQGRLQMYPSTVGPNYVENLTSNSDLNWNEETWRNTTENAIPVSAELVNNHFANVSPSTDQSRVNAIPDYRFCFQPNLQGKISSSSNIQYTAAESEKENLIVASRTNPVIFDIFTPSPKPKSKISGKLLKCEFCGEMLKYRSTLYAHRRRHQNVPKQFGCDVCGNKFSDRSDLRKHMRVHTGEQPFACAKCNSRFSQAGNLRRHEKNCNSTAKNN